MKEFYIKDKVISLAGKMRYKDRLYRLEKNRKIARINNMVLVYVDNEIDELKKRVSSFIVKTLEEEL